MGEIRHVYTNQVPDGTATSVVRPSDWNSQHAFTLQDGVSLAGNTAGVLAQISSGTLVLAGGNNVTLSQAGNSVTISGGAAGAADGFNILAAGTQTALTNTTLVFSNSNGISFGMSGSSRITASYTVPSQTVQPGIQSISAGATRATTGEVVFSNSNGVSFGLNGATVTASHNALTSQSGQAFSAQGGSSAFQTLSFSNANGLSFSNNAGQVQASYTVPTVTNSSMTVSDAATSGTLARLAFTNQNGVTLSLSTGAGGSHTIVGSHNALTSQSNQQVTIFATGNTTQSSTGTSNASSLIFRGEGIASIGITNGSVVVSVPAGGGGGDGGNVLAAGTRTAGTNSTVLFSNANGVTFGLDAVAGSVMTASVAGNGAAPTTSYYEPPTRGVTATSSLAAGTVYVQPFFISGGNVSAYRLQLLQQVTTQATLTQSFSGSVSGGANSTGASGVFGYSGTVLLLSRVSTGTVAESSRLLSFYSNTWSHQLNLYATVSNSTNASSATVRWTTSGDITFISNIGSNGVTTGSFGSTSSGSFSSTSTAGASFSSNAGTMSFGSQVLSGVRPLMVPFQTSLSAGEYFLAHIISTSSGSTNYSLQRLVNFAGSSGMVFYSTNTEGFKRIGSTASMASSNVIEGWGSFSASSQMTTTIPISQVSQMSNYQTWFNLLAAVS